MRLRSLPTSSLATSTKSTFPHMLPHSYQFLLPEFLLCWCFCPGCSLSTVPVSPFPSSWQISILPSAPTSSAGPCLPFPAVLQYSLPAPSLLTASFPFHLLPTPACPFHLPSPHLRWDPTGRWWQRASHQPPPVTKAVWDEPGCGTLGWDDTLCLAQTNGFLIWKITGGPGWTEAAPHCCWHLHG